MEDDKVMWDPDSKYGDGIKLEEYNGVYGLVAVRKGTDEKIYTKWGNPQGKDRKPIDKSI